MSNQRFTAVFREALWQVHKERCVYCERPLRFVEVEIDHVIPESTDWEELEGIKTRLGLDRSFRLLGYENLAPSCGPCNRKKREIQFSDGYISIILSVLDNQISALVAQIETRRAERDLDGALRMIARSVEAGKFTHEELAKGLQFLRKHPNGLIGSSPNAPPASPEYLVSQIYFSDRTRLIVTAHAQERMRMRDIDAAALHERIFEAVKMGTARFKVDGGEGDDGRRLTIDLDGELNVSCRISDNAVRILTVTWMDNQ